MAKAARPDPLAPPPGGWPAAPCGSDAERLTFAKWLWARPAVGSERVESDGPETVAAVLKQHAALLLNDLRNRADLPTMTDHRDRLQEVAATARKLRSQLRHFSGPEGVLRFRATQSAHARNAALSRLLKPYGFDFLEHLEPVLAVLEEVADTEAATLQDQVGGAGRHRLHDRLFGDPRNGLAVRSAHVVYMLCGPQGVRATDGGTVHRVMDHVWADATGRIPDECGIGDFLKKGIRAFRRNIVLLNRLKIR